MGALIKLILGPLIKIALIALPSIGIWEWLTGGLETAAVKFAIFFAVIGAIYWFFFKGKK